MGPTVKLAVYAAVAEMALVALAVFAWRHGGFPELPAPGPGARSQLMLVFLPVWLALGAAYAAHRLASARPRISDSHRRHLETGLRVVAALMVALDGLYAYVDVTGAAVDASLVERGLAAFGGLWMVTQGNAAAKLDPPSGDSAPEAGIWSRTALRFGWIMVALGLATVVCALALPRPLLLAVMAATVVICLALELVYRRMTRSGRPA